MGKQNDQRVSQALADVKAGLDATAYSSIAQHLVTLEKEYTTVSTFASSNLEDVEKYKNQTKELQSELDSKSIEVETLSKKIEESNSEDIVANITKERDEALIKLNEFVDTQNAEKKKKFLGKFESYREHVNFDKIKNNLKMAELKEDKLDWEGMEPDSINYNLSKIEEYEGLGIFGDAGINVPPVAGTIPPTKKKSPADDYPEN